MTLVVFQLLLEQHLGTRQRGGGGRSSWRAVGRNRTVNKTWLKGCGMLVQASVGLCVWERGHFNRVCSRAGGGEEVEPAIWMGEKDKRRNRREERKGRRRKGVTQRPTSTHLMLPAGPRDADNTVLLIHSPSPTISPVFCSQSLCMLPL